MTSSLNKLASILFHISGIQCHKTKSNIDSVNSSSKYIALLKCKRCKTKKTKDPDERVLKKSFHYLEQLLEL